MDTKPRNITKWYKSYVAKNDRSYDDVVREIPYTVVTFETCIRYDARKSWSSPNKLKAIRAWLKSNVNRDRYVYCIEVNRNDVITAMYDNGLWDFGRINAIAFQHESDAVLFKLACNDHIIGPCEN